MFFAVSQMGYEAGIAVLSLPISYLLGYWLLSAAVSRIRKYLSEADGHTLYDVIDARLGTRTGTQVYGVLVAVVTLGMYFFMLAGQFTILAGFYQYALNMSLRGAWIMSLGVVAGATLVYSVVGGIRKDIATDVFQMAIVGVGIIVMALFMSRTPTGSFTNVPRHFFTMTGYGIAFPVGVILFFSPAFLGRFDYWQRIIAAKTDKSAKCAIWASLPIIFVAYVVFCFLGIYARAQNAPVDPQYAGLWSLRNIMPAGVSFLVVLALYAAIMSTADTLLNVASVSAYRLSRRVLPLGSRRGHDGLRTLRIITIIVSVCASATVLVAPNVVDLIVGGFSSLVILAPSLMIVLFSKSPSAITATCSVALGYGTFLVLFAFVPPMRKYAFMGGFVVALVPVCLGIAFRAVSARFSRAETAGRN